MNPRAFVVLTLMSLAGSAAAAQGQTLELSPFAGGALFLQDAVVCEAGSSCLGQPSADELTRRLDNAIAFGAHVGVRWDRIALEGSVVFVPTDMTTAVGTVESSGSQSLVIYSAAVRLDVPMQRFVDGFLVVGGGLKQYTQDDPLTEIGFSEQYEPGTDPMFTAGAGVFMEIGQRTAIRVEGRNNMSKFDGFDATSQAGTRERWQHDLILSVGLTISRY